MNILSSPTIKPVITFQSSQLAKQYLAPDYTAIRAEKLIGVSPAVFSTVEDLSDNINKV